MSSPNIQHLSIGYQPLNEIEFSNLSPPFNQKEFFSLTDTWLQAGNAALFFGYAVLYAIDYFKKYLSLFAVPILVMPMYICAWNYFDTISRIFLHVSNIITIIQSHRDKKRKLFLEVVDMLATSTLSAGTTLSLLANIHVLSGALAVACAPLASLTPGFCSITMGFIEMAKCYKAYQRTKIIVLLRDRLKRYGHIKSKLEESKISSETRQSELMAEKGVMLDQLNAIARVGIQDGELTTKALEELINSKKLKKLLQGDNKVNLTNLMKSPDETEKEIASNIVEFVKIKQREIVRSHAFNASFWMLVGIGVTLSAVTTFFFPPLFIPGVVTIALAVLVKATELLELDKRIYNSIVKNKNQATIERNNPLINFLAYRKKQKELYQRYLHPAKSDRRHDMSNVPEQYKNGWKISSETRAKLRMAYELQSHRGNDESAFYDALLSLPWWTRRKLLDRATEKKIEEVMVYSCKYAKGFMEEDKKYYVAQQCRKEYHLFEKSKQSTPKPARLAGAQPVMLQF